MSTTETEGAPTQPKALKSGKGYLWSAINNGGEVKMVPTAYGTERAIVSKRNVLAVGSQVSKSDIEGTTDEQWAEWVEGGVVRDYPYPKLPAGSTESPLTFLQRKLNEAANSEEERLVAMVGGITSNDAELVASAGELPSDEEETTTEKKK